ncbi:MAG: hypothetical protein ACPGRY_07965, partial [Candidatus Latescibacterota bacterium]
METVCRRIFGLLILFAVALVAGCDRERPLQPIEEHGQVAIALPLPKIVVDRIAWVEYLVVADSDSLRGHLAIGEDRVARGLIDNIPVGPARLLRLSAYDALGELTYVGATTA